MSLLFLQTCSHHHGRALRLAAPVSPPQAPATTTPPPVCFHGLASSGHTVWHLSLWVWLLPLNIMSSGLPVLSQAPESHAHGSEWKTRGTRRRVLFVPSATGGHWPGLPSGCPDGSRCVPAPGGACTMGTHVDACMDVTHGRGLAGWPGVQGGGRRGSKSRAEPSPLRPQGRLSGHRRTEGHRPGTRASPPASPRRSGSAGPASSASTASDVRQFSLHEALRGLLAAVTWGAHPGRPRCRLGQVCALDGSQTPPNPHP